MMSACIVLDELVVKVNEARELAKLALSGGSREIALSPPEDKCRDGQRDVPNTRLG